jgi:hypothetical protein
VGLKFSKKNLEKIRLGNTLRAETSTKTPCWPLFYLTHMEYEESIDLATRKMKIFYC